MVNLLRPYFVGALKLAYEHPSVRRVETQSFPQERTQILDRRGILHGFVSCFQRQISHCAVHVGFVS